MSGILWQSLKKILELFCTTWIKYEFVAENFILNSCYVKKKKEKYFHNILHIYEKFH